MQSVAQILKSKLHRTVHTVSPDASVLHALTLMAEYRIGALLVTRNEQIVGIVSERDYARKVELQGRSAAETPVRDIMTADVLVVRPHQTNEECMALMTEKRLRHLPVVDDGKLVGIVDDDTILRVVVAEQDTEGSEPDGVVR